MTNREALENKLGGEALVIIVPGLPPAECSKNARVHWAVAAQAADQFAYDVFYATKSVLPQDWHADAVRVSLVIVRPYKGRSDDDNWFTRFKSGRDALVWAGVVSDDDGLHYETGTVTHAKGPAETRIIVEVLEP